MADTNAAVAVYDNHSEAEGSSLFAKMCAAPTPATSSFEFLLCRRPQCERS